MRTKGKYMPKVSIIVPVYNVEHYIKKCLDSLTNQTLKDIEIICVDDCSTDKSFLIAAQYAKIDSRIHIYKLARNSGQSAARNYGLKYAQSPYIMYCDSDDTYDADMCMVMYDAVSKNGVDIAVCGINIEYGDEISKSYKDSDKEYYRIKYTGKHKLTRDIIINMDVSPCNKIFKKSILDKYDIKYPEGLKYEDAYMMFVYSLYVKNVYFIQKAFYHYFRHSSSTMGQTLNKDTGIAVDHLKIAIKIYEYMITNNKYAENSEYFWKDIFIPYFNFARWHSGKSYQSIIYKIASDFVKKCYSPNKKSDFYTLRILTMIKNRTYEKTNSIFYGLVKIKETIDEKVYKFICIPVYKIKMFQDYQKQYFCGIQYKIKHKN